MHWNTEAMKKILEAALPAAVITVEPPGGDYDTEEINVKKGGGNASVFAMNTESVLCIDSPADQDADQLFATHSPRSGMSNASAGDMRLVADIKEALNNAGLASTQQGWKAYF